MSDLDCFSKGAEQGKDILNEKLNYLTEEGYSIVVEKTITQAKNIITHRHSYTARAGVVIVAAREHRPRTPPENGIHRAAHRPPRRLLAASRPVPPLQQQRRQEAELLAPRATEAGEAPPIRARRRAFCHHVGELPMLLPDGTPAGRALPDGARRADDAAAGNYPG